MDPDAPDAEPLPCSTGAPHVLLVTIPAPGHLFPFTRFAYQLAAAGAQVTCLTTGYVFEELQHRGDQKFKQSSSSYNGRVRFQGLVESKVFYGVTFEKLTKWCMELSSEELSAALERRFLELQPRPCCIVGDMFLGWVQDVANKFHVPRHTLFTMGTTDLAFLLLVPELLESGELPFNATGVMKKHNIVLPGIAPIPPEDVWRSLADGTHPNYPLLTEIFQHLRESSSIIVNTIEEFEAETFKALRTDYVAACNFKVPEILPILLSDIPRMREGSNKTNREEEDHVSEVEKWLDTQASASVIYISFGSLGTLSENQIKPLALALEAAGYPFVWVYRPPGMPHVNKQTTISNSVTYENSQEYFPPGFRDRVSGRALFVNGWAPQPQILTHPAVRAFLTHCGWNSTLESVCAGVPMICWPFWADQQVNARLVTDKAEVGFRIYRNADEAVDQDHIEKVLKQMMESEEGKAARSNALKFQRLAQENISDCGVSSTNLNKFVQLCCTSASQTVEA